MYILVYTYILPLLYFWGVWRKGVSCVHSVCSSRLDVWMHHLFSCPKTGLRFLSPAPCWVDLYYPCGFFSLAHPRLPCFYFPCSLAKIHSFFFVLLIFKAHFCKDTNLTNLYFFDFTPIFHTEYLSFLSVCFVLRGVFQELGAEHDISPCLSKWITINYPCLHENFTFLSKYYIEWTHVGSIIVCKLSREQARALRDLAAAQVVTSPTIRTNIFPNLQQINSLKIRESGLEKYNFEFSEFLS